MTISTKRERSNIYIFIAEQRDIAEGRNFRIKRRQISYDAKARRKTCIKKFYFDDGENKFAIYLYLSYYDGIIEK